ncbi:MAG TPA: thioredoxin family protein [Bacillota bacterium]|nr:thioredoxin family protein [Bacillota bacterium]
MNKIDTSQQVDSPLQFDKILTTTPHLVALIYAGWCPFCLQFLPIFRKYAEGKPHFLLARDDQEVLADRYGVDIIPTVLEFQDGAVTARLDGLPGSGLNETQLVNFIKEL